MAGKLCEGRVMKFNEILDDITVYEAGKPIELVVRDYGLDAKDVVKLASNENPNGASPKAVKAIEENAAKAYLYPDDSYYELKDALCKKYGVGSKELILGSGSDQVLEFATKAALDKDDNVLMSKVTFAMYEIYAKLSGAKIVRTDGPYHDVAQFKNCYDKFRPKIVFLCVPNNPLGECFSKAEVYEILDYIDGDTLAIVDCAYMEYARAKDPVKAIDAKELVEKYPNALYLGTFSKAYGLGGMRVGFGIASEGLTKALYKTRPPFNVTTLSAKAALAALDDETFVQSSVEMNFKQMSRYEEFARRNGIEFIDSYTNFITFLLPKASSKEIFNELMKKGVIVRDLTSYGINGIRITIGTPAQNDKFFEKFTEAYAQIA
jgi:histidinol-phosphate aminotransferase